MESTGVSPHALGWSPCGVHTKSTWTLHRFHRKYLMVLLQFNTLRVHVESAGLHVESVGEGKDLGLPVEVYSIILLSVEISS